MEIREKLLYLFVFFCFFGCQKNKIVLSPKHIQINCQILDLQHHLIKAYPGDNCTFFPNGEWVSIIGNVIDLHSKTNQLRRHFLEKGHLPVNLSSDQSKIYFISDEDNIVDGKSILINKINIADRTGETLKSWSFFEHFKELKQLLDISSFAQLYASSVYNINNKVVVNFSEIGKSIEFDSNLSKILKVNNLSSAEILKIKNPEQLLNLESFIENNFN